MILSGNFNLHKTHWFLQESDNQMEIAKALKRHVESRHCLQLQRQSKAQQDTEDCRGGIETVLEN